MPRRPDFDEQWARMNERIERAHRRFDWFHGLVMALIVAIWIAVISGVAWGVVTFAKLGPQGIAAEAGRSAAAFERAWSEAR